MGLVYLIVVGFLLMSVIYGLIWLYSRSIRREKLEDAWREENPDGDPAAEDVFVEAGMKEYHASIRPKLILLVYVIPTALVIAVLIVTNWN